MAHPQPRPQNITDHYAMAAEEYWEQARLEISPAYQENFRRYGARAFQQLGARAGLRALDIGCGIGKDMHMLRALGFDVMGIEPSPAFRARALEQFEFTPESIVLGAVEDVEFEAASFDYVYFGACLEHLYRPDQAIERAMRWLRPGGLVYAEVPFRDHLITRLINGLYSVLAPGMTTSTSPMHPPYHLYEFAPDGFVQHGRRAGYSVIQSEVQTTGHVWHVPRALWPSMNALMRASGSGIQLHVWLQKS